MTGKLAARRQELMDDINRHAELAIFGTLSESYRTCGRANCRCHNGGSKHGPHFQISYRGDEGKTSGYYVPKAAQEAIRRGVNAWEKMQALLRQLATLNKEEILDQARDKEHQPVPSTTVADRGRRRPRPATLSADRA